jgi:hypothetical protein
MEAALALHGAAVGSARPGTGSTEWLKFAVGAGATVSHRVHGTGRAEWLIQVGGTGSGRYRQS